MQGAEEKEILGCCRDALVFRLARDLESARDGLWGEWDRKEWCVSELRDVGLFVHDPMLCTFRIARTVDN